MKITAVFWCVVLLFLVRMPVLFSDEAEELPQTPTEVKIYSSGEFQSGVCRSPNLSSPSAPHWKLNSILLNNAEINMRYGVIVNRVVDHEGYRLSNITIPAVNLSLNNSTISCWVGSMVIVHYHMTVVEADLVYLPTEEYSNYCESPSATSRIAPHFKFNNISLNSDTVNEFYQANVTRGSSLDGRHRATLALTALGSTLNGSTVTCLINHSTVIWRVHLITIESKGTPRTTTAAMESSQTTDGINQTHIVSESPASGLSEEAKIVIPTVLCFLLLVFVAVIIIIVAYIYKRGKRERQSDEGSIGGPPDGDSQVPPPRPVATTPIVPQVSDAESQGPPVVTDEPVTVVTGSGRSPRHQRVSSLLRYPGENIGCSMMDPVDLPAVGTTTPTYLRPQSNSFSVEPGQDESEILKLSRQEESSTEGQSLSVPCFSGVNCKNVYKSFIKGWDDSSRQCQYVANRMSDELNNDGKQAYSAV